MDDSLVEIGDSIGLESRQCRAFSSIATSFSKKMVFHSPGIGLGRFARRRVRGEVSETVAAERKRMLGGASRRKRQRGSSDSREHRSRLERTPLKGLFE